LTSKGASASADMVQSAVATLTFIVSSRRSLYVFVP